MKQSIGVSLVFMTLSGCTTVPSEPVLPDGQNKTTVNNPATVAQVMADYYRAEAQKKARAEPPRMVSRLTLSEIVERYMPGDFRVFAAEGVDLTTVVDYETSRPWFEAIGRPLTDAGIEMTANLEQKTMMLRLGTTTVEQILTRSVPADYMVYADESVRLDMPIKLDRSRPWMEALGKALAAVGVSMTANVDRRMIVLKPNPKSRIIRFNGDVPAIANTVGPTAANGVSQRAEESKTNPSNN